MIAHFVPALLFGCLGLIVEVAFTSIYRAVENRSFKSLVGHVSLFMFPVYAGSYHILSGLQGFLSNFELYKILFFITIIIYFCEFTWGCFYRYFCNIEAWYYNHEVRIGKVVYKLHVKHLITIVYFPFWYGFSYVIWKYCNFINALLK